MAIPNAGGQAGDHSKAMVACGRDPDRCSMRFFGYFVFAVISARFLRCGIIAFGQTLIQYTTVAQSLCDGLGVGTSSFVRCEPNVLCLLSMFRKCV